MTMQKLEKDLDLARKDIQADFGGRVPDDMAYELARSFVENTKGAKACIEKTGVTDVVGWVADRL